MELNILVLLEEIYDTEFFPCQCTIESIFKGRVAKKINQNPVVKIISRKLTFLVMHHDVGKSPCKELSAEKKGS